MHIVFDDFLGSEMFGSFCCYLKWVKQFYKSNVVYEWSPNAMVLQMCLCSGPTQWKNV